MKVAHHIRLLFHEELLELRGSLRIHDLFAGLEKEEDLAMS
jgi:hypothetical protein